MNNSKISVIDVRAAWQANLSLFKENKKFLNSQGCEKILMRLPKQFEPMLLARSEVFEECNLGECNLEGWAFVSSPLCLITMVGGDSSPTSSLVVVFPHLCHTSSYILLVFPHLPMKSFQYWEISL